MFDLKSEVREWCQTALPEGCGEEERLEELQDHLHCEVDRLIGTGMAEQEAFSTATQRLGEANAIMKEYSKNQTFVSRLCALDRSLSGVTSKDDPRLQKAQGRLLLGNAIVWAVAMLAGAWLVKDTDANQNLMFYVFLPLWFASTLLIHRSMRSLRSMVS